MNKGSSSRALLPPPPEASLKTAIAVFPPNTVDFARPGEGAAVAEADNADLASSSSSESSALVAESTAGDENGSSNSLEMKEDDGDEAQDEANKRRTQPRSVVVSVRLQGAPLVSFTCEGCLRNDFESQGSLSGHRRFCDGGKWRCAWCACKSNEAGGERINSRCCSIVI